MYNDYEAERQRLRHQSLTTPRITKTGRHPLAEATQIYINKLICIQHAAEWSPCNNMWHSTYLHY